MEIGAANGPDRLIQPKRLSSVSQASPVRSTSLSPDDGYDYSDAGPPPEGSATRENENSRPHSVDLSSATHSGEPVRNSEATIPNLFWRPGGGRRAQKPDEDILTEELVVRVSDYPKVSDAVHPNVQKNRWHRSKRAGPIDVKEIVDKTKLRYVRLHWEKEEANGEKKIVLDAIVPSKDAKFELPNHVIWQHSELDEMELENFEDSVTRWKGRGLQESEVGLTRRLLKRVRAQSQRPFVGGSFVTPSALRYDILNDSKYSADKCCIFINFPYFLVANPQARKLLAKGDPKNPMRTLLQSHYRLNETTERDKMQCIKMLNSEKLKSCILSPSAETAHLTDEFADHLIHVPQMWALILGLDRMITSGPISDTALQGSSIKLRDNAGQREGNHCAYVRISFLNEDTLEVLIYPREQCKSWFDLMNKHQQIREILKQGNEKAEPKNFKLHIGDHIISDRTWVSVQNSVENEVLDLWMKTPKPRLPIISVKNVDSDTDKESAFDHDADEDYGADEPLAAAANKKFASLEYVPVVSAFLTWRLLDEFGEEDDSSDEIKATRFLNAIYRNLPAVCVVDAAAPSPTMQHAEQNARTGPSTRSKIIVEGKTQLEVRELVRNVGREPSIKQKVFWECIKLFDFFVPSCHDRKMAPIQLFWGALYELLALDYCLDGLLEQLSMINAWAERIHLGVYYQHSISTPPGGVAKGAISKNAILLASMVDTLGALFNLLLEAIHDARQSQISMTILAKKVSKHGDEACKLLKKARDELIAEATGAVPGENVGPVLTPEAILIMLIERLVQGVYGTGSVEIISIYEECLELLALKVKGRASRRLLQEINAFEEEVGIVNDVLQQQKRVLQAFRDCLDPDSFKRPSTARKMRFEFEKKGIERVLSSISEQLKYCMELRERAEVLAVQNVHLVETLQDDNGKAIFIFTFITVVFLPLSFIAGFFGMNVVGITSTTNTTNHFWAIAVPVTVGIIVLCGTVIIKGEAIWFAVADLPVYFQKMGSLRWKRKAA